MNIALVCPYAWDRPGGVQTHVRALAGALRTRGHDVTVLAPFAARARPPDGVVPVGRAFAVPANGSRAPISFGPGAARRVRAVLREVAPTVIHVHEPLIPSTSLLAVVTADVPVIGTFHASAERSAAYRVAGPILTRVARRLTLRTAVSDAAYAFAARYFPGEYELTPNGIDVDSFARATPERVSSKPTILFLNRIERRKGLAVLLRAVARLDDVEATLVVAGTGPAERRMRRLAGSLGVEATWLGRVHHDRVPAIYAGADIYCAPALGGESFGIVLLEAMAAGAPVACSDLPAFQAVAGDAAWITRAGDADALAVGLRRLLTDPATRADLAARGRNRAAEFSWARLVEPVEALYRRAVAGG